MQVNWRRTFVGVTVLLMAAASAGAQAPAPGASSTAPAPAMSGIQAPASIAPASVQPPAPAVTATPQGGTIKGTVKAGGVPLPGVAVTAASTLTGRKYTTTTDIDGVYQMQVPRNGRYVVKTELTGFASTTKEVVVNASSENGGLPTQSAEFQMDLASRVASQDTTQTAAASAAEGGARTSAASAGRSNAIARVGRGTQSLSVENNTSDDTSDATVGESNTGVTMPSLGDVASADTSATESIAVSGQQGQINGLAGFSEDDLRNRIQEMQRQGLNNGDIAGTLSGVMQSGNFGGPGGGPGPGGGFGGPGGGGPGGGFGGRGGRGGGFGGGGFGRFRGQNPNAWHGSLGFSGYNYALNANTYSVTGVPILKPDSSQNSFVASFTGTPYIPHLTTPNPKQFVFLSVQENRISNPTTAQIIVPTLAQRYGDLTPAYQAGSVLLGTNVYDPKTGQPYGNTNCLPALLAIDPNPTACIPQTELSPAALALLNYYPLPNIVATQTLDNYQANYPGTSHSVQASARYNRSFGSTPAGGMRGFGGGFGRGQNRNTTPSLRQSIGENFAYSHSAIANSSFSPLLSGSTATDGYSFSSQYTIGYGRLNNTATLGWNRSSSLASNLYTNTATNPAVDAGVFVGDPTVYSNRFYFGVPTIGISGGLSGLSEATAPNNVINQTITFSDFVAWRRNRHNMRFGFDFHRIHADSIGGSGVLGSFTFSGFATENPLAQSCNPSTDPQGCKQYGGSGASGSSMADFLLGLPQNTNVTASLSKVYLRGNSWDWYAMDDWRAKPNFTISYGLRWEYFSPYSEENGHLVNLNVTGIGNSLAVSTVCATAAPAGSPAGSCAAVQPGTLVKPDKSMFSPRIAIAWSPKFKFTKNTVIRSSYGINYNTSQYATFARSLAYQQPFSVTQKNVLSSGGTDTGCNTSNMTLNNGFNCATALTQSSYAVNPNYRLGMVQAYNFGIQRVLPQGVVLNIDYIGAYAGNLDMVRAPNRSAYGVIITTVGQFNYEDSLGYQRSNALALNVRNRMHKGVALGATYTYSHSIDDASSVGGSGNSIAQDDQNLGAEESNSSFDRRHVLNGNFVIEPPFGPNRAFFNKGNLTSKILDGFNVSGNFTFASGGWATPSFSGTTSEIAAGASGSLRPNRDYSKPLRGPGTITQWFNTSVFKAPATGQYGNATRNSIELPGTVSFNASLSRTISLGETRSLEMRFNANNVFNTVQYSGIGTQVNDTSRFGSVTSVAGMRSFTYLARFRF